MLSLIRHIFKHSMTKLLPEISFSFQSFSSAEFFYSQAAQVAWSCKYCRPGHMNCSYLGKLLLLAAALLSLSLDREKKMACSYRSMTPVIYTYLSVFACCIKYSDFTASVLPLKFIQCCVYTL